MKYGVTQSRNFTVKANSEEEAIGKMSNKWGEISSMDIRNGIKLDTCMMSCYKLEEEERDANDFAKILNEKLSQNIPIQFLKI